MKIHYAGLIEWENGTMLPGWAACCSGERAVNIREQGNHSYNEDEVTCKSCLKRIEAHKRFAPILAEIRNEKPQSR